MNTRSELNIPVSKQDWRITLKKRRAQASRVGEEELCHQLDTISEWKSARIVASYWANVEELCPSPCDQVAITSAKTVAYPRVIAKGTMVMCAWRPSDPTEEGPNGIKQPTSDCPVIPSQDIDFFLIPLLGCDDRGIRLGYGGGFYDRYLSMSSGFRCGLGFAVQRIRELPSDAHDQRLQAFLSPERFERFGP